MKSSSATPISASRSTSSCDVIRREAAGSGNDARRDQRDDRGHAQPRADEQQNDGERVDENEFLQESVRSHARYLQEALSFACVGVGVRARAR